MSHFDQYLADFALSGNRYNLLPRLTASGKASGMSADEIVERIRAVGVHDRDADVRRLFKGSTVDPNRRSSSWRPARPPVPTLSPAEREEARRRLLPKSARNFVPDFLRHYSRTTAFTGSATRDAFAETVRMSEDDFLAAAAGADIYAKQAARQLRALFRAGDLIWAGTIVGDEDDRKRLGIRKAKTPIKPWPSLNRDDRDAFNLAIRGIFDAYALADAIEGGLVAKIPTAVSLNPVTGKPDENGSFDSSNTIAAYRHALIEWDDLKQPDAEGVPIPTDEHIEIVAGLADYSFEHPDKLRVVSATYTGKKSIHVALRVKADDLAAYKRQIAALRALFTSADEKAFRVDPTGWDNGYTHIRLAGAIRPETGRRARLLWADDSLAMPNFSTPPCNPHGDPLTAYCGVCQEIGRCPHASKDTQVGTTPARPWSSPSHSP